ncbi:MAG: 30S ribosomal protein S8 [Parachlamydiaceae bacterium]|nr:30S ribosomal protein S8 [Parachlamydiaceae bacterium]
MAISDPIADFLTRIRNSTRAEHRYVDVSWSKMNQNIAEILVGQGFVESYLMKVDDKTKRGTIRLFLKYTAQRRPVLQGLRRMSRPGLRRYVSHLDIPKFYGGMGVSIVSTSQGVMAGAEACKRKIGGELLCMVW